MKVAVHACHRAQGDIETTLRKRSIRGLPAKIWAAALCASAAGWAAGRYIHLGFRWFNLGVIVGAFGVVYVLITIGAGIPEARSLLRRR